MRRALCFTQYAIRNTNKAFTLAEVMTALVILALISSGVLVVINRCATSAADTTLRMQAFEVARENMEKLLALNSVQESTEFGESDKYPQIKWQTVVETFYEPITAQMWVRAVCSAEYNDTAGQTQTVELTHWLTNVTDELMEELTEQQEQEWLAEQILETIEEAAQYADVDVQTIRQWIDNGMLTADDGSFFKYNLDIYTETEGNPNAEEKNMQISSVEQLLELVEEQAEFDEQQQQSDEIDPVTGLPYHELENMDVNEIFNLLKERHR